MTNLGKVKAEVILDLVISLNRGNSGYIDERVQYAIEQYDKLVESGVIKETDQNEDEVFM